MSFIDQVMIKASTKATYLAGSGPFTAASSATDIWNMTGSGTKTVKILAIWMQVVDTGTTPNAQIYNLIRRSAANSGGTSTSISAYATDTNFAAATATLKYYTANPAGLGTAVGTLYSTYVINVGTGLNMAHQTLPGVKVFDAALAGAPIVLRGTSDILAIHANGASIAGTSPKVNIFVLFTEE